MENFSEEFKKGEKSMAKAVLRRIKKGKPIGHIEMLCVSVLNKEADEYCDHCGIHIEDNYNEVRFGGKVFCSEWCADLEQEEHIFNNQN